MNLLKLFDLCYVLFFGTGNVIQMLEVDVTKTPRIINRITHFGMYRTFCDRAIGFDADIPFTSLTGVDGCTA